MKIQLCIDAVMVAETEVDTSPGSIFQALEVIERLGSKWDFRLDPTEAALEPRPHWDASQGGWRQKPGEPRPYYYESTLINVWLIP
jgi:hypothetical protein